MKLLILFFILSLFSPVAAQVDNYEMGDVNMDGILDVTDLVLLVEVISRSHYEYLTIDPAEQIRLSDVNQDGYPLHIADLIYFIKHYMIGDSSYNPFPQKHITITNMQGTLTLNDSCAVIKIIVEGHQTPVFYPPYDNKYGCYVFISDNTSITIALRFENLSDIISGKILKVDGEILVIELSDSYGQRIQAMIVHPSPIVLHQNYPNPAIEETIFPISAVVPTKVEFAVFNLSGQKVFSWAGNVEAGQTEISWNTKDNAPGVYLYKILNHPSKIMKLVLLR